MLLLRKYLRRLGLGSIRVASVDDFQGAEERVIFISTVVSRDRQRVQNGNKAASGATSSFASLTSSNSSSSIPLGLLRNSKRFNVALSRSKALTVVVGNPILLSDEENWRELLIYAIENGAYAGCSCPLKTMLQQRRMLGGGLASPHHEHEHDHTLDGSSSDSIISSIPVRSRSEFADPTMFDGIDPDDITLGENEFFDGNWRILL